VALNIANEPAKNIAKDKEEISHLRRQLEEKNQHIYSLIAERDRFQMLQHNNANWVAALTFLQGVITGDSDTEIQKEALKQWSTMVNKLFFPSSSSSEEKS
jgi:predicted RNase H-like nuclease (RuvC/YqgF family)